MTPPAGLYKPTGEIKQADPGRTGQIPRLPDLVTISAESLPVGLPEGAVIVRSADQKGRFNLGAQFANVTFIFTQGSDATEFILTASSVIPMREIWLYQNPEALASVMRGIKQARAGQVSESPPDIDADCPPDDEG